MFTVKDLESAPAYLNPRKSVNRSLSASNQCTVPFDFGVFESKKFGGTYSSDLIVK